MNLLVLGFIVAFIQLPKPKQIAVFKIQWTFLDFLVLFFYDEW
jgi:hypothetical protein